MLSGISLWGLFEYTNETLFDGIELTERLSKDLLITNIIDKHGQLDLWQQHPDIVKRKIKTFFLTNYDNFDKMAEALQAEYNPLENYDRYENTTENRDTARTGQEEVQTEGSTTGEASSTAHSEGGSQTDIGSYNTEHKVSADNESTYQPLNKDEVSARTDTTQSTDETSASSETSGTASENVQRSSEDNTDDDFERESHIHGNIGVTTSQQMLESELEVRKFNIYDYIADLCASEFLLRVY